MAEVFSRSHVDFPFSIKEIAATSPYYLICGVEADFTVDEFRFLFGAPSYGSSSSTLLNSNHPRWILRDTARGDYIVVLIYVGEDKPTIFASSLNTYHAFVDYIEEGLEFVRGRQGYGC